MNYFFSNKHLILLRYSEEKERKAKRKRARECGWLPLTPNEQSRTLPPWPPRVLPVGQGLLLIIGRSHVLSLFCI
jgi:hypothetical protein